MESILLIIVVGFLMALSFLLGARTSQKAYRGEEIKLPTVNPLTIKKDLTEQYKENKEQRELNTMLENIDNYDGTGLYQKEIK